MALRALNDKQKKSHFWLRLVEATLLSSDTEVRALLNESYELILILSAIRRNTLKPRPTTPK